MILNLQLLCSFDKVTETDKNNIETNLYKLEQLTATQEVQHSNKRVELTHRGMFPESYNDTKVSLVD